MEAVAIMVSLMMGAVVVMAAWDHLQIVKGIVVVVILTIIIRNNNSGERSSLSYSNGGRSHIRGIRVDPTMGINRLSRSGGQVVIWMVLLCRWLIRSILHHHHRSVIRTTIVVVTGITAA